MIQLCAVYHKCLIWTLNVIAGNTKGEVLLYCWPPVWLVWNQLYDNWQFWLFENRVIQTSQIGGQQYSDTPPFSIPWLDIVLTKLEATMDKYSLTYFSSMKRYLQWRFFQKASNNNSCCTFLGYLGLRSTNITNTMCCGAQGSQWLYSIYLPWVTNDRDNS